MISVRPLLAAGPRPIVVTFSANTANPNLYALAGSPAGVALVVVRVLPNVKIYSTSALLAAFFFNTFANNSRFLLLNSGFAIGKSGRGANANAPLAEDGGNSIELASGRNYILEIDNSFGYLYSGGGGGGAGESMPPGLRRGGGGGGGSGRGFDATPGGLGDSADPFPGSDGAQGDFDSPGLGGAGGVDSFYGTSGGRGGDGGDWGAAGALGEGATISFGVGIGGNPGYAVRRNGNTVIWLGGNNPNQVKGLTD